MRPGDGPVQDAFVLGWQVSELLYLQDDSAPTGSLPLLDTVAGLPFADHCRLLAAEIMAGVAKIAPAISGVTAAAIGDSQPDPQQPAKMRLTSQAVAALKDLHSQLLRDLTVQDFRLGKAYSLGAGLAETMLVAFNACIKDNTDPEPTLSGLFEPARVRHQLRELSALKTSFQSYAADAVEATLHDWAIWVHSVIPINGKAKIQRTEKWPDIAHHYLHPQLEAWRALLSGEKQSTDVLQVADYLNSVQNLVGQYWTVVRAFVVRYSAAIALLVPVAALVAIGAVLFAANQSGPAYAAVVAVLGFLGISGATVTAAVKNALSQTEQHLWEAELAGAVALAIDHLPDDVPSPAVGRLISTQFISPGRRTKLVIKAGGVLATPRPTQEA